MEQTLSFQKLANKNAPAMVGAFDTHHRKFMCGCNNIYQQILNQTCTDYTTSLTKIEGEGPRAFDRVELVAEHNLLRLFFGHGIWFAGDLHRLHPIDI
jgi:hypothetical protein